MILSRHFGGMKFNQLQDIAPSTSYENLFSFVTHWTIENVTRHLKIVSQIIYYKFFENFDNNFGYAERTVLEPQLETRSSSECVTGYTCFQVD